MKERKIPSSATIFLYVFCTKYHFYIFRKEDKNAGNKSMKPQRVQQFWKHRWEKKTKKRTTHKYSSSGNRNQHVHNYFENFPSKVFDALPSPPLLLPRNLWTVLNFFGDFFLSTPNYRGVTWLTLHNFGLRGNKMWRSLGCSGNRYIIIRYSFFPLHIFVLL